MSNSTITWKTVRGSQPERPEAIDKTSSESVVYMRRNIHRVVVQQDSNPPVVLWEYEEAVISQEEYAKYDNFATELLQDEITAQAKAQAETNAAIQADIEYLFMMTDIEESE